MQNIEIIYEDRHMVAVLKPARLPVASESSGDETLLDMVRAWNESRQLPGKKGYCVPIHFLDRPVSGVVVFARSSKAAARLNALFRGRLIKKTYVAISEGYPERDEATLEHWLAKDRDDNRALMAKPGDADAKKCLLSYRVLERRSQVTMIEVWPETGRSHQIRAQLAAVGCPLVGDVKYGARSAWDGKVALHAACLEFSHPVGGTPMLLRARVPGYWESIWPAELPDHVSILFDRSH